jgi:flagellar basal body-associated protein FliL
MAHEKQKVGLASSMAVILMVLIILVTVFQKVIVAIFFDEDKNGKTFGERRSEKKRAKEAKEGSVRV